MEYNSTRDKLKFPEYGRHVQDLVDHLRKIEDKEEKQAYSERIVDLMYLVDHHERNNFDNRAKLWKHLFMIAEYDLEGVTPSIGEIPTPENTVEQIYTVDYPQNNPRFRHYGNNVMKLISKAKEMEDPEKKEAFINVIGSYMKLAYKNWNREHYVNDEVIKIDLQTVSDGELEIKDDLVLDFLHHQNFRPQNTSSRSNNNRRRSGGKDNRGRGGSNRGRDNRGRSNNNNRRKRY